MSGSIEILAFCRYYLPAYKAGGPIKTIAGMVQHLYPDIRFSIVACDRDYGDNAGFPGIVPDAWRDMGDARVCYIPPRRMTLRTIKRIINSARHDILYLNSFFDPHFSISPILLHKIRLIHESKILIAPRGEFSRGAIALKHLKKTAYIRSARLLSVYENVYWQASSEHEIKDIQREFGAPGEMIYLAQDLSPGREMIRCQAWTKEPGRLKAVFLSRITAMKNLAFALELLPRLKGQIAFDIYGPIDRDKDYWEHCRRLIARMPNYVAVKYRGPVEPHAVNYTFAGYDLFLFPTRGENFGHVILESLAAGCPALISDTTPWLDLEKHKAGWVYPLDNPELFVKKLQNICDFTAGDCMPWRDGAARYASARLLDADAVERNRKMFRKIIT